MTVRRREEYIIGVSQLHAEKVSVLKETTREDEDNLIIKVKVAEADSAKTSVERNILVRFQERFSAMQTMVNAHVEQK